MRGTVWLSAVLLVAGCTSDEEKHAPYPDVSGYYFSQLVNGPDTCGGSDWPAGETYPVDVTLSQDALVLTIEVSYSSTLGALVGAHTFPAALDGLQLVGTLEGDKPQTSGACTFTYRAELAATVSLNTLSGNITYAAETSCAPIAGCSRVQTLTGERAPMGTQAPN